MRSVTYVREVAGLIAKAAELPGGVYNYGSENDLSMLETAKWLANELKLNITLTDAGPRRNLWMDTAKLKRNGISFLSTVDELRLCISDYALKDR